MKLPNYIFQFNGLRFNANYLRHLFANASYMHALTINEAAEFVDAVTYASVKQGEVLTGDGPGVIYYKAQTNLTSLGNTAFIALYHPSEMIRQEFTAIFNYLKNAY